MRSRTAGLIVGIIYLALLLAAVFVALFKLKRGSLRLSRFLAVSIAFIFSLCAFSFAAAYSDFRDDALNLGGARHVDGRLCDFDVRDGHYTLILDDLTFDGESAKGKLGVSVRAAYHNTADFLEIGDRVFFFTRVDGIPLVADNKVNGASFRSGVIYSCTVGGDELGMTVGKPKPIEKLLSGLKSLLAKNMGERYGNIAYSMITGDKYGLSDGVSSAFSAAGLGHILAVSGLHVGFVVLLVNLVMFRANRVFRFAVTTILLAAYIVIADFSPSVIRAAVMTAIAELSVFVGGRRDLLSSLMCAFSGILAFRPIYLFEAGFLMSFGAIFGIAAFADIISRTASAHGVHRKVAGSAATALSVQAGIVPAQAYFFGTIQPLAILVNIVVIPYLAVAFVAILATIPIAAIPNLGAAVGWCKYLLMPIDYIAQGVSAIPHSTVFASPSCAVFLCYPIMFCMSDFFMLPKSKTVLVVFSALLCASLFLI